MLLAALSSLRTGAEATRCGHQPTTVFVQKGVKRMVSFWHHPESAGAEPSSGEEPNLTEQQEEEEEAGETALPTAATELATPLIVTAGPPPGGAPTTPLYDQQPHIILPEAPPGLGWQDGAPPEDEAADEREEEEGSSGVAGTDQPQSQPSLGPTETDVTDQRQSQPSLGPAETDVTDQPQSSLWPAETDGTDLGLQSAASESAVHGSAEGTPLEGSGIVLFDGDDIYEVILSDVGSPVRSSGTFDFINFTEGSGEPAADSAVATVKDSGPTTFDRHDAVSPAGESVVLLVEGSGTVTATPAADAIEGSGVVPGLFAGSAATQPVSAVVLLPQEILSAAADRPQTSQSDGLETDELLPLAETYGSDAAGDLAVSATEPVAAVAAAVSGEAEKERLLVVKQLQQDRVILEDAPDATEDGSSGDGAQLNSKAEADSVQTQTDDIAVDGSGMPPDQVSPESRQQMESEIIKAVVDVMTIMTDIHGLVGKKDVVKPAEEKADVAAQRPNFYRYVDAHAKPNQAAAPHRPVWRSAYSAQRVPSRLPASVSRPGRPPGRPRPAWERLRHRLGLPDTGHVYFPGQFRRGDQPAPLPPGGSRYAAGAGLPIPALPGFLRRGPSPAGYGRPFKFNARNSLRHQDDNLRQFLRSQPYPFASALTGGRPAPASGRRSRAAPVDCQWQIQTEPHLYLLVTLHNLSAPLTVDCNGAYIEVERENDGFEARWCGDRVRKEGARPHLVFARGEVRIAVHSGPQADLPTGFDAEVEVIDLLDGGQYVKFRRSGLNFRRLIQEPLLPAT